MARRKPISRLIGASPIVDGEVRSTGVISTGEASGSIGTFDINNSLRFDGSADYMTFSQGTPTSSNIWTFSCWVKRSANSDGSGTPDHMLLAAGSNSSNYNQIAIDNVDTLRIRNRQGGSWHRRVYTTDTVKVEDGWTHIVVSVNGSDGGISIHINGQVPAIGTSENAAGASWPYFNSSGYDLHIGRDSWAAQNYFNGQMAEVHFIDGTAYDASYFGETRDGVWLPKEVTGLTYGNNGFYLDFAQPSSTINAFNAVTYTGSNSDQDVTVGFQPDFAWIKCRNEAISHSVWDSVRGADKLLAADTAATETTLTDTVVTDADGMTLYGGYSRINNSSNGRTYVAWCWKAGGSSNTYNIDDVGYATASAAGLDVGSITPTGASVNTETGFSIIGYEGNETSGATVAHGLNQTPELIMVKTRDLASRNWYVGSSYLTSYNKFLYLNTTNSELSSTSTFNDTAPTSSVFTLGNSDGTNASSSMIAYCWHSVEGYSKIGSYVGGGSNNVKVKTGFRPAFVLIKNVDNGTNSWGMFDNARDFANGVDKVLFADYVATTEGSGTDYLQFDADGFTVINSSNFVNQSGNDFIYMAFADTSPNLGVDRTTDGTGVVLLMDGTSKTTDLSSENQTISETSTHTSLSNETDPFGNTQDVLDFSKADGTNGSGLVVSNAPIVFGNDPFTIEMFIKLDPTDATHFNHTLYSDREANNTIINFRVHKTGQLQFFKDEYANGLFSGSSTLTTGTWYHVALTYDGSTLKIFLDGKLDGSSSQTLTFNSSANPVLGYDLQFPDTIHQLDGRMAQVRITKGVARYSSSFTPPTSALSADVSGITGSDDVVLLLDGNGTSGSTTFTDKSSSTHTITVNGDTQVDGGTKKFGSGSIEFDGTGDYLTGPTSTDFAFGSGDFTIESWVYFTGFDAAGNSIVDTRQTGNVGILLEGSAAISGQYYFRAYNPTSGHFITSSQALSTNTWYHVALVRNGNNYQIFVNGVSTASVSNSVSLTGQDLTIGASYDIRNNSGTAQFTGHLDDLRITKGAALYPFHPPISALTNDDTWDKPKNNFSVEGNITPDDQLLDTPNLRFATLDPDFSGGGSGQTLSEGNLKYYCPVNNEGYFAATESKTSGKWYFEMLYDGSTNNTGHGIVGWTYTDMSQSTASTTINPLDQDYGGMIQYSRDQIPDPVAVTIDADASVTFTSPSTAPNDIFGIAFDADTRTIWFSVNNTWFSGDPGTGQSPSYSTLTSGKTYIPFIGHFSNNASRKSQAILNFGQDHTFAGQKPVLLTPYSDAKGVGEFYYEPPSGFLALAQKYS